MVSKFDRPLNQVDLKFKPTWFRGLSISLKFWMNVNHNCESCHSSYQSHCHLAYENWSLMSGHCISPVISRSNRSKIWYDMKMKEDVHYTLIILIWLWKQFKYIPHILPQVSELKFCHQTISVQLGRRRKAKHDSSCVDVKICWHEPHSAHFVAKKLESYSIYKRPGTLSSFLVGSLYQIFKRKVVIINLNNISNQDTR